MLQKTGIGQLKFFLLSVFCIAFLLVYLTLSLNNRLAADDYFYLKNLNQHGVWIGMIDSYSTWVTRWSAILFLNVVLLSYNFFHSLLPYHLLTLLVFVIVMMDFLSFLSLRFLKEKISFPTLLIYVLLFIASFFFFSFSIGETFFWVASTTMYLWSVIFIIAGVTNILKPGNKWLRFCGCFIFFIFAGGYIFSLCFANGAMQIFFFATAKCGAIVDGKGCFENGG